MPAVLWGLRTRGIACESHRGVAERPSQKSSSVLSRGRRASTAPLPHRNLRSCQPGEHALRKHRKDHHKPEVYGSFPLWCSGRSGDSFRCFRFVLPISRTVCSRTVRPPFGPRGLTAILSDERQMGDTVFARGRRKRSQSESHGPRMAFEPFALSTFRRRLKLSDARRTRRQGTGSRSESFWSRSSQD